MPPRAALASVLAFLLAAGPARAQTPRDDAYNAVANPLDPLSRELLADTGYELRLDGKVWDKISDTPVRREEMPYLLGKLAGARRLRALLELNIVLNRSEGEKRLTPAQRDEIRAIVRRNWAVFGIGTRKDFRTYFSVQELEELDKTPPRFDRGSALVMRDPDPNAARPEASITAPLPESPPPMASPEVTVIPTPLLRPEPEPADPDESPTAPMKSFIPKSSLTPIFEPLSLRRPSPFAKKAPAPAAPAAPVGAVVALPPGTVLPPGTQILIVTPDGRTQIAAAPAPANSPPPTPAPTIATAPDPVPVPAPAPAPVPIPAPAAPPVAAPPVAAPSIAAAPAAVPPVASIAPKRAPIPVPVAAPLAAESAGLGVLKPWTPPGSQPSAAPEDSSASPLPLPGAESAPDAAPAPAPTPVAQAPASADALLAALNAASAPVPVPAPARPPVAVPAASNQAAPSGLGGIPTAGADEVAAFIESGPYGREARALLQLVAQKAPDFCRPLLYRTLLQTTPLVVFDGARTGANRRVGLSPAHAGALPTIALSPGPVLLERRSGLFGRTLAVLPEDPRAWNAFGILPPALEALKPDATPKSRENGPWGETRVYADGSRRGTFSVEQQAGELLERLLLSGLEREGFAASLYAARSWARAARLLFSARLAEELKGDAFLDPDRRQELRDWLERPDEDEDRRAGAWSSARGSGLDPRRGGPEDQAAHERAARQECVRSRLTDELAEAARRRAARSTALELLLEAGLVAAETARAAAEKGVAEEEETRKALLAAPPSCAGLPPVDEAGLRRSTALLAEAVRVERAHREARDKGGSHANR